MTTINRFLFFLKTPPCVVALWSITNYLTIWSASSSCFRRVPSQAAVMLLLRAGQSLRSFLLSPALFLVSLSTPTCSHLKSDTVQNKTKNAPKKSSSRLNQRKFHSGRCGSIKSRKYFPLCINGSILFLKNKKERKKREKNFQREPPLLSCD